MKFTFAIRNSQSGRISPTRRTCWNCCGTYNHATNPAIMLSEHEDRRSRQQARAVINRIRRIGFNVIERSNGQLWPVKGE